MQEWIEAGIAPEIPIPPSLLPHEAFALNSYLAISSSRPASMGAAPMRIPVSEVFASYVYYDLWQHYTRGEWARTIAVLDSVLIEHIESKASAKK